VLIDASALTAMIAGEDDARDLLERMARQPERMTSPLAVWETVIAVARRLGIPIEHAAQATDEFLALMSIDVVAVPSAAGRVAIEAYRRFGKGRHPASLNFGDCFAYACARITGVPLLYKGDDFPQTDIEAA
jgi:ribonuclease VapC